MKSKLLKLTFALFAATALNVQAQTLPATLGADVVNDGFEAWTGSAPTTWNIAPASTILAANVTKVTNASTLTPVQSGSFSLKMVNTASSYTSGIMATNPVAVTGGMGYQISFYARGKGTITSEVTDGSAATSSANYTAANGQSVSSANWRHFYQTVVVPTTTNNAQFALKVKSTGTYTNSSGVSITGVDVDSFVVRPYTPVANVSLYDIEYTVAANTNSPFYAQQVIKTGGIVTGITPSSSGGWGSYYIQTTGSNAWASALVFDLTNAGSVALGDSVTFGCAIDEYFGMTELVQITNWQKVSSGNPVPAALAVTTQTMQQEQYEGFLVKISNAVVQTYSANFGEATATDVSGVPGILNVKAGFYPPNGTATAGSSGNPGYVVTVGNSYCFTGNINYSFSAYMLFPRDSADVVLNCLNSIENHTALNANVFPNPINNALTIQLPFVAQKVNVSFVNVLGKEVLSTSTSGSVISLNNLNLPAGVYMVKIIADDKTQMVKIIKE